ncbi:MAG: response regulator [Erysipelotrichaceae bacterium]|nr:response regulator [Erysipelotrichaceae bacterium]
MSNGRNNHQTRIVIIGSLVLAIILVAGTMWMGDNARKDTEEAVRSVSLLYLDELAGRREQVVENNLQEKIETIRVAINLMTEEDLSDKAHLEAYQTRMKQLYHLDKFAFVDKDGLIYTSTGTQDNINEYDFDYKTLSEPEISLFQQAGSDRRVIIAVPVNIQFHGETLSVCFMAIDMQEMLSGVSLTTNTNNATFCNIYTQSGVALTDSVLGGLAKEDNLLDAMKIAVFEKPYSNERFAQEFQSGSRGVVSFTFNGIRETLTYIPVVGTDWQLTYLIRESVISDRISSISEGAITRSIIQSAMTVVAMLVMFSFIISQTKRNNKLLLQQETAEAENRIKQEELERRLALQEKLLEEERQREQQDKMITALAADYWSVYYIELDKDEGVCYQAHTDLDTPGFSVGEHFKYLPSVTAYANQYITEPYREEFLKFIQPDAVREGLKQHRVISHTYMVKRHGKESYETVRFARVSLANGQDDQHIDSVGACFVDVDANTRSAMEQQQALSDALTAAEEASKAKTTFLSHMSHEIRTPMNAIIGLDSIALNDPDVPEKTREYLEKIGSSADHLLGLINDILDMSRIESGRLTLKNEEFSFQKLLEAINTIFSGQCQDKGLDYHCRINSEIDEYYIGDNMKLRQILINILGNAVKFTPSGGKVELQVERTAKYDGKSTMRFTISDTGIGMSKEYLPHLFDTFSQEDSSSTTKFGSTGLGMAITKSIVELMNGHIEVESEKGVGTTFVVTVTLSDSERTDLQEEEEIHPSDLTVLIVDDDPIACQHAQLVLEKAGISSEMANSGKQAIEMVKLRHARMEPYNLILVDWKMPEMDGVETTRQIRAEIGNESAIIILTAYRWDDVLEEALKAGVDSFLPKPLFATAVLEEFKSALKRKDIASMKQQSKADLAGKHILLAEDIDVNAEIIRMVLQMRKMEVDRVENGKKAVELFSEHPEGYYDAILMDMRMPEMDGLEATRTIRAMERSDAASTPIIALTANAFDEDVQRSMQAGLNAHLSKPVQPELLFETLESLIKN